MGMELCAIGWAPSPLAALPDTEIVGGSAPAKPRCSKS